MQNDILGQLKPGTLPERDPKKRLAAKKRLHKVRMAAKVNRLSRRVLYLPYATLLPHLAADYYIISLAWQQNCGRSTCGRGVSAHEWVGE